MALHPAIDPAGSEPFATAIDEEAPASGAGAAARRQRLTKFVIFTMLGLVAFTLVGVVRFAVHRHALKLDLTAPPREALPAALTLPKTEPAKVLLAADPPAPVAPAAPAVAAPAAPEPEPAAQKPPPPAPRAAAPAAQKRAPAPAKKSTRGSTFLKFAKSRR